jgi:hypothetical protein
VSDVPAGFEPLFRVSPLGELLGPIYYKGSGDDLSLALQVQPKHTNLRGTVHGGVIASLADMALGYTLSFATDPPSGFVTWANGSRVGRTCSAAASGSRLRTAISTSANAASRERVASFSPRNGRTPNDVVRKGVMEYRVHFDIRRP